MIIKAWIFSKSHESTKRPIATGTDISVVLKERCDVERPVFTLKLSTYSTPYNFFAITLCGRLRYYYLRNATITSNNHVEIECIEDYLATAKDIIMGQYAINYIERCQDFDMYKSTGGFVTDHERDIKYFAKSETTLDLLDIPDNTHFDERLYLIGLVGSQDFLNDTTSYNNDIIWHTEATAKLGYNVDAFCIRNGISYYLLDGNGLTGLASMLESFIQGSMESWTSNFVKYVENAFKNIVVLPISLRKDGTRTFLGDSGIEVFWKNATFCFKDKAIGQNQNIGFQCYSRFAQTHERTLADYYNLLKTNGTIPKLINQYVYLPTHPDSKLTYSSDKMCVEYLNYAPYMSLELRIPFSNSIKLDTKKMGFAFYDTVSQKYVYYCKVIADYDPVECSLYIRLENSSGGLILEQYNIFGYKTSFHLEGNDTNLISALTRLTGGLTSALMGNFIGAGVSAITAGVDFVAQETTSRGLSGSVGQTNSEVDTDVLTDIKCVMTYAVLTDVINEFGFVINDYKTLYGLSMPTAVKMRNAHFDAEWSTNERDEVCRMCNEGIFLE